MSDDRELLRAAGKAAGEIGPDWYDNPNYLDGVLSRWNPLTDDGDALRLAVQLCLYVTVGPLASAASWPPHGAWLQEVIEAHGLDRNAATRRAIVRAAAEIGKTL